MAAGLEVRQPFPYFVALGSVYFVIEGQCLPKKVPCIFWIVERCGEDAELEVSPSQSRAISYSLINLTGLVEANFGGSWISLTQLYETEFKLRPGATSFGQFRHIFIPAATQTGKAATIDCGERARHRIA